jgi:alginate O-acetyltransferase complex protein AlgI
MLFNSLEFAIFFPIVTALYFLFRQQARVWLLLAAGSLFYMAFVPKYLLILLFIVVVDYFAALAMERAAVGSARRRWILGASLVVNLGTLAIFKYYNFFATTVAQGGALFGVEVSPPLLTWLLPIGLSFHTFQAMAYTIEVYRGRYPAEQNWAVYALYVLFYPQLVAGPIERPQGLLPQLHRLPDFNSSDVVQGLQQMLWGLIKKVVIADRLTVLVDLVYQQPNAYGGWVVALAMIGFSFQIYCDFSGYTDIAIGAARVMGVHLMKNFDRPYLAGSVTEFWKRWHISLSSWFRDYLYIPLGGGRASSARVYANVFFVFLASGFWHGASWTFVAWGAIHGALVCAERALGLAQDRKGQLSRLSTFFFVTLAWVFFRAPTFSVVSALFAQLSQGWTSAEISHSLNALGGAGFSPFDFVVSIFLCGLLVSVEAVSRRQSSTLQVHTWKPTFRVATYYAGILLVLLLGKFTQEQFIYFQF